MKICIIGLGYVGLPLSVELSKHFDVIGFDINFKRIEELKNKIDSTNEIENATDLEKIYFTANSEEIKCIDIYIITVPTPIDEYKTPNLNPLKMASELVGKKIRKGNLVVYESTVYPGCTEEFCVPILEKESGLKYMEDFSCGYSPERINPGDKINTLRKIKKVVSASDEKGLKKVVEIYSSIIDAGIHIAPSIKVAEASKAIENAQRDLNISFVNELSLIFERMDLNIYDVLEAAGTKWNFLNFRPGLVGGHCISVDPYYLTYKSQQLGYYPEVINSGRRVNDKMPTFWVEKFLKNYFQNNIKDKRVLIHGVTFKKNCPDIRNSKVFEVINKLKQYSFIIDVYDCMADKVHVQEEYDVTMLDSITDKKYNIIFYCVNHDENHKFGFNWIADNNSLFVDITGEIDRKYLPINTSLIN